jgi:two-component system KDP operon response regulator KdpE
LLQRGGAGESRPSLITGGGRLEAAGDGNAVVIDGRSVALTRREAHLLGLLMAARGATVGHDSIVRKIWGPRQTASRQNLRRVVAGLRRKLEAEPARPRVIMSVRGSGYRIAVRSDVGGSPPETG